MGSSERKFTALTRTNNSPGLVIKFKQIAGRFAALLPPAIPAGTNISCCGFKEVPLRASRFECRSHDQVHKCSPVTAEYSLDFSRYRNASHFILARILLSTLDMRSASRLSGLRSGCAFCISQRRSFLLRLPSCELWAVCAAINSEFRHLTRSCK